MHLKISSEMIQSWNLLVVATPQVVLDEPGVLLYV